MIFKPFLKNGCLLLMVMASRASAQEHWQQQTGPFELNWHDVFFLDDTRGWVYAYGQGRLIHTTDGGNSWHHLYDFPGHDQDYYFEQIQFLNDRVGWMIGDYGFVYQTSDGGRTWQERSPEVAMRLRGPDVKPEEAATGVRILYYAMHWFAPGEGLVAGKAYNPENRQEKETLIWRTSNAGQEWQRIESAPEEMLLQLAFPTANVGFATSRKAIFRTEDQGHTWMEVFRDSNRQLGQIRGLFCLSSDKIWACGFSGGVARSLDGGKTWLTTTITENRLRSIVMINPEWGFAGGDQNKAPGSLFETRNGGTTWQKVDKDLADLHRIQLSPQNIWIVGKQGTILRRSSTP